MDWRSRLHRRLLPRLLQALRPRFPALPLPDVSSCILLALACASTGAWPSFLTNAIFIGVGCTMIWRVRDRLARRIMQVLRFFDVRRYLPRRSRLARAR